MRRIVRTFTLLARFGALLCVAAAWAYSHYRPVMLGRVGASRPDPKTGVP